MTPADISPLTTASTSRTAKATMSGRPITIAVRYGIGSVGSSTCEGICTLTCSLSWMDLIVAPCFPITRPALSSGILTGVAMSCGFPTYAAFPSIIASISCLIDCIACADSALMVIVLIEGLEGSAAGGTVILARYRD